MNWKLVIHLICTHVQMNTLYDNTNMYIIEIRATAYIIIDNAIASVYLQNVEQEYFWKLGITVLGK